MNVRVQIQRTNTHSHCHIRHYAVHIRLGVVPFPNKPFLSTTVPGCTEVHCMRIWLVVFCYRNRLDRSVCKGMFVAFGCVTVWCGSETERTALSNVIAFLATELFVCMADIFHKFASLRVWWKYFTNARLNTYRVWPSKCQYKSGNIRFFFDILGNCDLLPDNEV